jgi:hypothetical protein
MKLKSALRWTAIYRAVTLTSGVVMLAMVGASLYLGLDDTVRTLVYGNPWSLRGQIGRVAAQVLLVVVGFVQWQLLTTVAYFKTLTEATEEQMAERFDSEKVKSEVLSVLDDRLAEMQTELERTRKQVEDLDSGGGPTTQTPPTGNAGDASAGGFDFEN